MVFPDYDTLSRHAASEIFLKITRKLNANQKFVLGMATGNSPIGLYKNLIELFKDYQGSLSGFHTVNLDEYFKLPRESKDSYYYYMTQHFWKPLADMHESFNLYTQTIIPDGVAEIPEAECKRYEEAIKEIGGVDVQILGIGTNGHIGFNEPGTKGNSRTSLVELAEETIEVNKAHFGGDPDLVPRQAYTMGIGTIMEAKEIVLIASGKSKAPILQEIKDLKKPTEDIPASFLLEHPHVEYFVDEAAAGK